MAWWDIDILWPLVVISQLSGLSVVAIILYWIMEYNEAPFSWGKHDGGTISYHSFMFTLMVFLFGEAMLLFPVLRRLNFKSHIIHKLMHGFTQGVAVICTIVGLKAIFLAKDEGKHSEFYSIHSWLGMTAVAMLFLQYGVASFIYILSHLTRMFSPRFMIRFTSTHSFIGYVLFAMVIASCVSGMDRCLQIFEPTYTNRGASTLLGDFYALLMLLFGISVAFIASSLPGTRVSKKSNKSDAEIKINDAKVIKHDKHEAVVDDEIML